MVGESFEEVHARLRALLVPYAPPLFVTADGPKGYVLDMAPEGQRDTSTWFGGTRLGALTSAALGFDCWRARPR